jgi:DNA polymerase
VSDALADELAELVRASRATLEWYESSGSDGLASDLSIADTLALVGPGKRAPARANAPAPSGHGAAPERAAPERVAPAPATPAYAAPAPRAPAPPPAPRPPKIDEGPALVGPELRARLTLIDERVRACTLCELHAGRQQTVFARGNPDADLVFVGEGPGADEDAQGLPFVGKAGQLLDKMIAAMGMTEDDVYICNIVKCRPPNNRVPAPAEMASCLPYLNEQLDLVRPKVIVALGSTALKGLLGAGEGITKARGNWKIYRGTTPLMPTFHPAYVLRTPSREVKGMVWSDLQAVLKQLGRTLPKRGA